jgi:hypothetical protein
MDRPRSSTQGHMATAIDAANLDAANGDGRPQAAAVVFRAAVLMLALSGPAMAAPDAVHDYRYSAQTIVTGTVEPERTRGFREGLADVFVKLTGDIRLASDPRLAPYLRDPHPLVEHFEYEDRMKGIPVHDEQGTRERPHYLRMRFKPAAMDAALKELGLRKWSMARPPIALWLGVRRARDSYVLQGTGPEGYEQRLVVAETAARRGLPVVLPGPAERRRARVTVDAIADPETLWRASPDAAALLSGVLALTPDGYWDIAWRFEGNGVTRTWAMRRVTFDTAIREGLERSALILSGNEAR